MLSIQAVRGLPRLRAPGTVPCIISFSRQLTCFLVVYYWNMLNVFAAVYSSKFETNHTAEQGNGASQPSLPAALNDKLVWSRRPPSSTTRRNQYDAAGALARARRRGDVTRYNSIGIVCKYDVIT